MLVTRQQVRDCRSTAEVSESWVMMQAKYGREGQRYYSVVRCLCCTLSGQLREDESR